MDLVAELESGATAAEVARRHRVRETTLRWWRSQLRNGQDFSPEEKWNRLYQPDHHTVLVSPVIPTAGFDRVRLQALRWLAVEDGFFDQASILADD